MKIFKYLFVFIIILVTLVGGYFIGYKNGKTPETTILSEKNNENTEVENTENNENIDNEIIKNEKYVKSDTQIFLYANDIDSDSIYWEKIIAEEDDFFKETINMTESKLINYIKKYKPNWIVEGFNNKENIIMISYKKQIEDGPSETLDTDSTVDVSNEDIGNEDDENPQETSVSYIIIHEENKIKVYSIDTNDERKLINEYDDSEFSINNTPDNFQELLRIGFPAKTLDEVDNILDSIST